MDIRDIIKLVEEAQSDSLNEGPYDRGGYSRYSTPQRRPVEPKVITVSMSLTQAKLAEEALRHVAREIFSGDDEGRDPPEAEALQELVRDIRAAMQKHGG